MLSLGSRDWDDVRLAPKRRHGTLEIAQILTGAAHLASRVSLEMLRCGPLNRLVAASIKSNAVRIHTTRVLPLLFAAQDVAVRTKSTSVSIQ